MFREYELEAERVVTYLIKEAVKYDSVGMPEESYALRKVADAIDEGKHRSE